MVTLASVISESERLKELEAIVDRGLATFLEVGQALAEIRDSKLYKATHSTFRDYCKERFGLGPGYAYRLIDASKMVPELSPVGDIPNEAQARALVPLWKKNPERAAEVFREARETHGGRLTAAELDVSAKRALNRIEYLESRQEREPAPQPTPRPARTWTPRDRISNFARNFQALAVEFREVLDELIEPGGAAYVDLIDELQEINWMVDEFFGRVGELWLEAREARDNLEDEDEAAERPKREQSGKEMA